MLALGLLVLCLVVASNISETRFLNFVESLEQFGSALAIGETLGTAAIAGLIAWNIRTEKSRKIWLAGGLFALIALAANMGDYFGTLQMSPDLALEVSPIWNGLLKDTGLDFAKFFGLFGKIFVSIMAGASLVFYLRNLHVLMPKQQQPLSTLIFHLGERCSSFRERCLQFGTVFAFYFAAVNLFCFYVTYCNSLVTNLPALSQLPALPAAVCIALVLITAAFLLITHRILQPSFFAERV
jgi:hypothetical protein